MIGDKTGRFMGLIYVLISAILFGSAFTLAKEPLKSVNSLMLSSIVYLISGASLMPVAFRSPFKIKGKKQIATIVIIAILGAAVAPLLLFFGLEQTEPTDAAILVNGEIIFTILFAWIFFGEKASDLRSIASIILVITGLVLATTELRISGTLFQFKAGNIMILAATVCWALDNNISRRFLVTSNIDPAPLAMIKSFLGGSILFGASVLLGRASLEFPIILWPQIIFMSVFGFGYALLFFLKGLKKIGTVRTMIVFSLTPIFGIVIAIIATGASISYIQVFATALIIFGIIMINRKAS
jgi:drug/metabolite transporter (DMT)-like permease